MSESEATLDPKPTTNPTIEARCLHTNAQLTEFHNYDFMSRKFYRKRRKCFVKVKSMISFDFDAHKLQQWYFLRPIPRLLFPLPSPNSISELHTPTHIPTACPNPKSQTSVRTLSIQIQEVKPKYKRVLTRPKNPAVNCSYLISRSNQRRDA